MKILLADCGRHWRGGQQQTLLLYQGMLNRGLDVIAVARAGSPLHRRLLDTGGRVEAIRPLNDASPVSALKLARLSRTGGRTIAHASDSRAHALLLMAGMLHARPALLVTRRVTTTPGTRYKYRSSRISRYIAVSRAVVRALTTRGIPEDRISLVPSGIPIGSPPGMGDRKARSGTVVTVSFCSAEKGLDTVIEAAVLARNSHPGIEWLVVGDGPLRPGLEARVRETGALVTFTGFRETPGEYLDRAQVLVHVPSSEGLGTVLLEAMARGVPIVASAVGGIPEVVDERVASLIPPGRPAELLEQVVRWIADPRGRRTAAVHGPSIARRFSTARMIEGTLEAYRLATDN